MNRTDAVQTIKGSWRELYPADGKGKGIICPCCGSGSGPNGTGISEKKGSRTHFLKCWNGGCDFSEGGSVIDLYMREHGLNPQTDFIRAVDELAARLGLTIDATETEARPAYSWDGFKTGTTQPAGSPSLTGQTSAAAEPSGGDPGATSASETVEQAADPTEKPPRAFYGYFIAARERLLESPEARAYLAGRGISMETAVKYALGYDPAWVSPTVMEKLAAEGKNWRPAGTPRIIIPSGPSHYVARDIRPADEIPEGQAGYVKMNEGSPEIFGLLLARRSEAENIFITEGAFDALSIIEAGQVAIAINSTSNADKLIKTLEAEPISATFIICLDNDPAGRKTTAKLQDGLRRLNISCIEANVSGPYKDPNEHLTADRAGFEAAITKAIAATAARPDSVSLYIDNALVDDITRRQQMGQKKTGLTNLDEATGGGLRPGLYLIGGATSLGKTTFCSQLADGIASAGHDVIYISLEQSRLEMVSKSIARETAKIDMGRAITGGKIMDGYRADIVEQAARNYKNAVGNRLSIIEGGMNCDTLFITDYVRNYYRRTGERPVVIVDYLQIMTPGELPNGRRQDTRETVEECIRQLVNLKRELDLTILAIVSLNRTNYLQPFSFESIKETGLAEYSADAVWGLQLQCLDEPLFSEDKSIKEKRARVNKARAENPRKIKLCSLKHRGQRGQYECYFDYYPQYDLFIPSAGAEPASAYKRAGKKL